MSNITQWGIDHINGHYRQEWGDDFESLTGQYGITAEEIFAYTYAVLHDPTYRQRIRRGPAAGVPTPAPVPRTSTTGPGWDRRLLDLHIGFESAEPYPLERHDREGIDPEAGHPAGRQVHGDDNAGRAHPRWRAFLRRAWEYRLGSHSALEWVLDQYKERKPRDPTIREKFNTYRFLRPQGAE